MITRDTITIGSKKKVWFRCPKGHEYIAAVYHALRGNGCPHCAGKRPRSFEEARVFAQSLDVNSFQQWIAYCKSGKKPANIPASPQAVYRSQWQGWGDWLGTGRIADRLKKYRPFEEARQYAQSLNLLWQKEWQDYCKSGNKPDDIPAAPWQTYKSEWINVGDWLGTGNISSHDYEYLAFHDAKKFVKKLNLKKVSEWKKYCASGDRPRNIPSNPNRTYKSEWINWGDWLGTGKIAPRMVKWRDFEEARSFVVKLNIKSQEDWIEYAKTPDKPFDIPACPSGVYKKEWKGYGYWLGTGKVANFNKNFKPFKEARAFARSLNLNSEEEWIEYMRSDKRPIDIPCCPYNHYKDDGWNGMLDWLGIGINRKRFKKG